MIYEYENAKGERREIVASMKNPPPECVAFEPDDSGDYIGFPSFSPDWPEHLIFRRVYTVPQVGSIDKGGAVNHAHQKGELPTSCTLPPATGGKIVNRFGRKVREVGAGLYATMDGRRIVDSKSAGDRHAAQCGYVREK